MRDHGGPRVPSIPARARRPDSSRLPTRRRPCNAGGKCARTGSIGAQGHLLRRRCHRDCRRDRPKKPLHAWSFAPLAAARRTPRYGSEGRPCSTMQIGADWTISRSYRGSRRRLHNAQYQEGCRGSASNSAHGARRLSSHSAGRTITAMHPHGRCAGRLSMRSCDELPNVSLHSHRTGPTGPPRLRRKTCVEGPRCGVGREVPPALRFLEPGRERGGAGRPVAPRDAVC